MRIWPALAVLSTMIADGAIMSVSPEELPVRIETNAADLTIVLDGGSTVRFVLGAKTVTQVLLSVGSRQLSADLRTCTLAPSIHTGDMRLIRYDLREDEHRSDALT